MKNIKNFKSFNESVVEGKWFISYGLSGGFGGARNFELFDGSEDEANRYAWNKACEDYSNYEGMHGLRNVSDIMEEDGVDSEEAETIYEEERESWLDYSADPYNPAKHDEQLNDN